MPGAGASPSSQSAAGSSKISKDTPFKTRLRDHVMSELGDLEVNTTGLTPTPIPSTAGKHAIPEPGLSADVRSTPGPTTTPGGIDADDEDDFEDDDDEMDTIPEAEKEYYLLAEKDKPLSARVLYPSDDEMGEFFTPSSNGLRAVSSLTQGPIQASPMPASASTFGSSSIDSSLTSPSRQKRTISFEVAKKTVQDPSVSNENDAATTSRPTGARKKVPIRTRLTMTSRAGFFQDRIVSPSMLVLGVPI